MEILKHAAHRADLIDKLAGSFRFQKVHTNDPIYLIQAGANSRFDPRP